MLTYFLLGTVAVLAVIVVELIQSRKRLEACLAIKDEQMNRLFNELNALENHANTLIAQYNEECA